MTTRRQILTALSWLVAAIPGASWAQDGVIRMPVDFTDVGAPIIKVMIDGQGPYRFMIDTGAFASGIRYRLGQSLKLQVAGNSRISGLGFGIEDVDIYMAREVVFAGAFKQSGVALLGLTHIGGLIDIDGLLAAGFLTSFPSQLDYESREIRIYPHHAPALEGFVTLPSYLETGASGSAKIVVKLTIDGMALKVGLDTGSGSELLLFPDTVRDKGLWDKYPPFRDGISTGVTGKFSPTRLVTMPHFTSGGLTLESLPVKLMDPQTNHERNSLQGLLGSRLLRQFTMAVNGEKGVAFRRNANFVAPHL